VTRTFRVTREHLRRFAEASGDRNPLHVDEAYARATPYGRCICQGALVTIAALGVANAATLEHVRAIHVQFKQPVFPDEEYAISLVHADSERAQIEVTGGGRTAVTISTTADPSDAPVADVAEQAPAVLRTSPRHYTLEELAAAVPSLDEPYACDLDALSTLAGELEARHVPRSILLWLSAASYTVGMVVPGEDALFVGARIVRSNAGRSGVLSGSVTAVDDRTGLVNVEVGLDQQDGSARMTLLTFLRPPVPPPDRASIERYLSPSAELSGRTILVVGGSRGLGAALSGAFAMQGATVWVGFAHSRGHAENLRSEFGAQRIRLLQFDAEDAKQTREAFAALRDDAGVLDGVVVCAAPPLYETALHPAASDATLRFVSSSLAMTLVPLAESLQVLSPDGWLVVVSSSGLEDPPEVWPHYTIAKTALEGAAAYCKRHASARVLVVRPPKMWTDSTNTPLGRLGAVPKEQVAAAIVQWATSDEASRPSLLTGDELTNAALERPSA
jgi:NAD(P)-dependent dehydrogenase (short-subunit alcohol dehydrogenase family)/acyl dehydratase